MQRKENETKRMNALYELVGIALLSVLYRLAWRNQPGREPVLERRTNREGEISNS